MGTADVLKLDRPGPQALSSYDSPGWVPQQSRTRQVSVQRRWSRAFPMCYGVKSSWLEWRSTFCDG